MNYALAALTGILLAVLFPHLALTWFAPVALAPLLLALSRERRWRHRFLMGWLAGTLFWAIVCYWIQGVLYQHGGLNLPLSLLAFTLFSLAKGLHMAVFALGASLLMPLPFAIPAVAALWAGIERTHGPLGFAWLCLGNAAGDMSVPLRLAPYTGVYGMSFVLAMMAVGVVLVVLRRPRRQLAWLLALPALYLLPPLPAPRAGEESAVLVQPAVADDQDWTAETLDQVVNTMAVRSLEAALDNRFPRPLVIMWPEAPGPWYYYDDPRYRDQLTEVALLSRLPLLTSVVGHTAKREPLNSALLIGADGRPVERYDKMYLVPFGEFVPPMFSWVGKVTSEAGDFAPGDRLVLFPFGERKLGAFICYESAFPHLVRRFVAAGAGALANLSNDGYFGHTAARRQHILLVRMRAVENARWVLRPTNDGITAVIDPAGRIRQQIPPYKPGSLRAAFSFSDQQTVYTRYGDWFAWSALAFAIVACVVAWFISSGS